MLTTNPQPGKGNAYMCNVIFSAIQFWMDRRSGKGEFWEHDRTNVGLGECLNEALDYILILHMYIWRLHCGVIIFLGIQYPMDVYGYTDMGILKSVMYL
jgi:hypothetical protein